MEFKVLLAAALEKEGFSASERQLSQADLFTKEMLVTNETLNLTAITEPQEMVQKHWLDSLAVGRISFEKGETVLDVGSGAGFPGVPLCIFFPEAHFTLLDSLQKRLNFIASATEKAGISTPVLLHARAEEAGRNKAYRESFDTVISRAVANLTTLCEYCLPFVKVGGRMVAYKGPGADDELSDAAGAIAKLGAEVERIERFALPSGEERNLIFLTKTSPCAPCYPRNSKAIKNKPL